MSKIKVYELTSELDKLATQFFEQIKATQLELGERVHALKDIQEALLKKRGQLDAAAQAVEAPAESVPEAFDDTGSAPAREAHPHAADSAPAEHRPRASAQPAQAPRTGDGRRTGFAPREPRPAFGADARPQGARKPAKGGKPISAVLPPPQEKEKVSNYDPNRSAYSQKDTAEKKPRSRKATLKKQLSAGLDDRTYGSRRPKRKTTEAKAHIEPIRIEHAVITAERVTVKTLAEKIGKPAADIIKKLMLLDIIATINQEIDFDTAALVAGEYGITLEQKLEKTFEEVLIDESASADDDAEHLQPRPPVVTIMGHVDHGKTTLLDAIRYSRVAEHEAGGITQHIGAYTVEIHGRQITFLDTPGHEAFTAMRARGAQVTDIAILVVAADDGIMPQTVEAINHAKAAEVPIIIAINKMDKPTANPDRIKQELTEYGIVAEEWGGDAIIVPVSAVTKEGIDQLLEMILLVADMQELRANPDRLARGAIIEAQLDKGRGPVATVLVQTGTLRVGDTIVAGTAYGRVRAMNDDKGEKCEAALPSQPVEVLGFSEVPEAGDVLYAVEGDKLSRQVAQERRDRMKVEQLKAVSKVSLDDLFAQIDAGQVKELRIIIKADVQGSVEAVRQALEKLSNPEVRVKTIHGGVGAINEADIMLASASNAIVIGFNVRPNVMARQAAENEKIDVRTYRVIYNAIEDIENAMKGMLEPTFREVVLGHVEVRNTFRISGVGTIAGCYVTDGKITRNAQVRVLRDNVVIHEGKIDSLKRFKDDVREVTENYECGVGLVNFNDIKEGDIFEVFVEEEVER
jgi:translation initiation factor IF-2